MDMGNLLISSWSMFLVPSGRTAGLYGALEGRIDLGSSELYLSELSAGSATGDGFHDKLLVSLLLAVRKHSHSPLSISCEFVVVRRDLCRSLKLEP